MAELFTLWTMFGLIKSVDAYLFCLFRCFVFRSYTYELVQRTAITMMLVMIRFMAHRDYFADFLFRTKTARYFTKSLIHFVGHKGALLFLVSLQQTTRVTKLAFHDLKGAIWVLIASVSDLCIHFTSVGITFNY